jgi:uncharacterized protein (TIGR03435 family)
MRTTFPIAVMAMTVAGFSGGQAFEVASIKPSAEMGRGMSFQKKPGGTITTTNTTLKDLMVFAYDVRPFQISGGPSWVESAGFNIIAKPEGGEPPPEQMRTMLQKLLADRFQMTLHRETREMPVYALVVAKGGPKFHASTSDHLSISGGRGQIVFQNVPIKLLAENLAQKLGRTVLDKTDLKGSYDFTLHWIDEKSGTPESADTSGPSIFTALQEELGLKLDSTKGPVEILVIDRAAKPSEN